MLIALLLVLLGGGALWGADAPRAPHPPPVTGEVRPLTSVQLGNFAYDPMIGGNIPADVLALEGLHVRMKGTVTPWDLDGDKVVRFALTDGQSCCFGGPPKIQHVVAVSYAKGMDIALADGWVAVEGVLHVKEQRSANVTTSLFTLTASAVSATSK